MKSVSAQVSFTSLPKGPYNKPQLLPSHLSHKQMPLVPFHINEYSNNNIVTNSYLFLPLVLFSQEPPPISILL